MQNKLNDKKIILLLVYAILMFISIVNNISIMYIILLFIVVPICIYFYVRWLFPKK